MITSQTLQQRAAVVQQQQQQQHQQASVQIPIPNFAPLGTGAIRVQKELRKVTIPPHRFTPLRQEWANIMKPLVEYMKLQVRVNPKSRCVEMKVRMYARKNIFYSRIFICLG